MALKITRASFLYETDNTENWMFNDTILKYANPIALEIPKMSKHEQKSLIKNFGRKKEERIA